MSRIVALAWLMGCGAANADSEPTTPPVSTSGVADAQGAVDPIATSPASPSSTPPSLACRLAMDFNACIVERLVRPTTEQDYILLVNSHRVLGQNVQAEQWMRQFLSRFPDSPQARTYHDVLAGF